MGKEAIIDIKETSDELFLLYRKNRDFSLLLALNKDLQNEFFFS